MATLPETCVGLYALGWPCDIGGFHLLDRVVYACESDRGWQLSAPSV